MDAPVSFQSQFHKSRCFGKRKKKCNYPSPIVEWSRASLVTFLLGSHRLTIPSHLHLLNKTHLEGHIGITVRSSNLTVLIMVGDPSLNLCKSKMVAFVKGFWINHAPIDCMLVTRYCKDTEPLYHSFMYSLTTSFHYLP